MNRLAIVTVSIVVGVFFVAGATEQPPTVTVTGPTVIAFCEPVTDAELGKNPDMSEVFADFQVYAGKVREPLKAAGIEFHELYTHSFHVVNGKAPASFRPGKIGVGYYFIAPKRTPRVEYGVMTDADLLQLAAEYFKKPCK